MRSHSQHQTRCPDNPDRVRIGNQFIKAKAEGRVHTVSTETRKKISEISKQQVWTAERRMKHSESMRRAVSKYPEAYSSSNRGRVKEVFYKGVKFQGEWELDFYKWCMANGVYIERCTEWFDYVWQGNRKYNPDFYLPELDIYIEVKGYETDRDRAKWRDFPRKLRVIKEKEIKLIRERNFTGL